MDLSQWQEFGLVGLMCGAILIILWLLIDKAFAVGNKILDQSNKQAEAFTKALGEHTASAQAFHAEVKQAHEFQRKEHELQISSLRQIEQALGRINGYVHEK